ncbi:hypothetical protein AMS68_005897 [Peltaster fructicola]|uniref:J domain-containing protein n=1 Tax=Peltaster fructicola TaxID=286661 RepID=A0A6H0Y156_9PEZI|nr:hypothetical protein AMS68_005897 [Peltaster fructicola]
MGAGQSYESAADEHSAQVKTSYYELLGIQRQATEDEIKKAYRRKALELHPDRNYGNEEEATRTFAEVQAAYEILSDPQERAWYDSHETAILRGEDGNEDAGHSYENIKVTTADDLARIVRKFNSNVEFNDAPSGFFGYLSEQFAHLAKEEEVAAAWENVNVREYPPFGHKDDSHDDVVKAFYSAWLNFSTAKSFAWKDKYRLSEAPDRRIRRLMEKENNNLRQEAVREFNEAVRSFVLFVRKRDPRYQPSTQSEAERQQVLRDAAAAQRARARAANQAKADIEVAAWTQNDDDEVEESEEEEEVVEEVIECVVCDKVFKSERQYEAHARSKKHQKATQALQRKMKKENEHLQLDEQVEDAVVDPVDWQIIEKEEMDDSLSEIEHVPVDVSTALDNAAAPVAVKEDSLNEEPDDDHETTKDTDDSDESFVGSLSKATIDDTDGDTGLQKTQARKMGKAAQKRAKRAAATSAEQTENNHKCAGCNAAFPSRTQLFQHIKKHGHAALKTGGGQGKKKR